MRPQSESRSPDVLSVALLALMGLTIVATRAMAQSTYPPCQPPLSDEYLVLVPSESTGEQEEVRRVLPPAIVTNVCNYLNTTVTRLGGFATVEDANQWAQYINTQLGTQTFVARPSGDVATPEIPIASNSAGYNPQPLGTGYAVLVDFFNNPQLAAQLGRELRKDIGLVSYGQRPYLLVEYTRQQQDANRTLQRLSDRGFFATVVDSRNVILLDDAVSLE